MPSGTMHGAMRRAHTLLVLLLLLALLVWLRLGFVARRLGAVPVLLLAQVLPILAGVVLDEVACATWRRCPLQQDQTRLHLRSATEIGAARCCVSRRLSINI